MAPLCMPDTFACTHTRLSNACHIHVQVEDFHMYFTYTYKHMYKNKFFPYACQIQVQGSYKHETYKQNSYFARFLEMHLKEIILHTSSVN